MGKAVKVLALALLITLVYAADYEFNVRYLDSDNQDRVGTITPINTGSVVRFKFLGQGPNDGSIQFVADKQPEQDGKCGGQLGIKGIGESSDVWCLEMLLIDINEDSKSPKTASIKLVFGGPNGEVCLKVPLFKENHMWMERAKYNFSVLRFEPITFGQLRRLRVGDKAMHFEAPWLAELLQKDVFTTKESANTFATTPVIMPSEKMDNLVRFVNEKEKWIVSPKQ